MTFILTVILITTLGRGTMTVSAEFNDYQECVDVEQGFKDAWGDRVVESHCWPKYR